MRCLTTSPAGTSTWTPASFRIDSTAGSVVAVTAGSRWVRSSTRLTGTASSIEMGTPLPMGAPRALTPALLGVDEHLAVALRARHGRVGRAQHPAPRRLDDLDDPAHRVLPRRLVAHDPAGSDAGATHLELRLDHHHGTPAPRETGHHRAPDRADRDEGEVTRHEVRRPREVAGCEVPRVGALHDRDARVLAQPPVELAVAHVQGDHARRPAAQQAVGEPAGGRAEVEGVDAGDVDGQGVERARELEPAPRDVAVVAADVEFGVLRHAGAGLVDGPPVDPHAPGHDGRLGPRPAREEAPGHEGLIES